jgi:hypothetical protein
LGKALIPVIPLIQTAVDAMVADPAFAQMIGEAAKAFVKLAPSLLELIPSLVDLGIVLIPLLIEGIPILIPIISFLGDTLKNLTPFIEGVNGSMGDFGSILFHLSPILGFIGMSVTWLNKTFGAFGPAVAGVFSPLGGIIGFFMNLLSWIEKVISGWNDFWALVTGKPLPSSMPDIVRSAGAAAGLRPMATGGIVMGPTPALVGEAGPEAIIPLDRLGKMGGNSYNINVTAGVGDPAAIGQQIVTYIKKFERSGGPVFVSA